MSNPGCTPEQMQRAVLAVHQHGTVTEAAKALNMPRGTFHNQYQRAILAGVTLESTRSFEIDDLPDELPTAEELLNRREEQFRKKEAAEIARKLVEVRVKVDGPFGVALFGDPHVDDNGTDIRLLREHVKIVNETDGLFAGNVGDYSNNWIGRLARLYGQQSTSAAEAWVLVEWLIKSVPWVFLIGGNHDCWSGSGDPIKWMAKSARVSYEAHGMRLGLTTPKGRVIRLNARHDFSGKSQYDTAFGVAKAARNGWRDHVLVCGHTHVSGYHVVKDPASGLLSHAIRVGSYKTFDSYAKERGLPDQSFSCCPVCVIRPEFEDDDPRLITTFFEPGTAAEFLTFLKKRKSSRAA